VTERDAHLNRVVDGLPAQAEHLPEPHSGRQRYRVQRLQRIVFDGGQKIGGLPPGQVKQFALGLLRCRHA